MQADSLSRYLIVSELETMWIADAKQELDTETLILEIADDIYFSAYRDPEEGFLLSIRKVGQLPYRLVKAADWESFDAQIPPLLKEVMHWESA